MTVKIDRCTKVSRHGFVEKTVVPHPTFFASGLPYASEDQVLADAKYITLTYALGSVSLSFWTDSLLRPFPDQIQWTSTSSSPNTDGSTFDKGVSLRTLSCFG